MGKRILIIFSLLLVLGYGMICWFFSNLILTTNSSMERTQSRIAEHWHFPMETYLAKLPPPKNFEVKSFDENIIRGKYFQRKDTAACAIVLVHGWSSTWAGMLKYTPLFEDCDCDIVMYDHRSHGASGKGLPSGSVNEARDLMAVTNWVQKNHQLSDTQIGWMGASWGGATVLKAGAESKNVGFIIADAPFQDWYSAIFERAERDYGFISKIVAPGVMQLVNWRTGVDYRNASPILAAPQIDEPVLLIHSEGDTQTASTQSVNISKHLTHPNSVFHHTQWGSEHTRDILDHTDQFIGLVDKFMEAIDGFGTCE